VGPVHGEGGKRDDAGGAVRSVPGRVTVLCTEPEARPVGDPRQEAVEEV